MKRNRLTESLFEAISGQNRFGRDLILLLLGVVIGYLIVAPPGKKEQRENRVAHRNYIFGIDLSQYQGKINWGELNRSHHPIKYIFIRATMGNDGQDHLFQSNWKAAKKHNYIVGAYHYYRPFENSTKQFENFRSVVTPNRGPFIPILDIEKRSRYGADNLRRGVRNWLKLAEQTYGVKPVIYTGRTFYRTYLKGHFKGYPLWIASYSGKKRLKGINWQFHQFTDKVRVRGVNHYVDGNDFRGTIQQLRGLMTDR